MPPLPSRLVTNGVSRWICIHRYIYIYIYIYIHTYIHTYTHIYTYSRNPPAPLPSQFYAHVHRVSRSRPPSR
ncbi:hypothetical protein I7I53_11507 [Histoplasma capsulatum var. duboisii H88]|uniref:Uncharacterized protein n=1 Tax=Ajellomyces capsulatus (strain H88) TaxID=544711 RepID=A0A8A1LE52_AJEC8|nr:hypothetical protein I7I53_11507 [Histoplasma capsulatum var. duboisii H88]